MQQACLDAQVKGGPYGSGVMEDVATIARIVLRQTTVLTTFGVLCLILVPAAIVAARRVRWSRGRVMSAGLAAAGVAAILATTLGRSGLFLDWGRGCGLTLGLLSSSPEVLLNLVLFVPASAFGVLALRRPFLVAVLALCLSVGVEAAQSLTGVGTCQAADVTRNVAGALVAAVCAGALVAVFGRRRVVLPEGEEC